MVSARTGGLAVALGLGYAVVTATGVASADTTDGSAGADSTSTGPASTSSTSSTSAGSGSGLPASASASAVTVSAARADVDSDGVDSSKNVRDEFDSTSAGRSSREGEPKRERLKRDTVEKSGVEKSGVVKPTDVDEGDGASSAPPAEPAPTSPTPAEATQSVSASPETTTADPVRSDTDAPAVPADSLALATVAAVARHDLADVPAVARTSATAAAGIETATTAAAIEPAAPAASVVAIEQTPPFEFLQQIPIFGPGIVTPLVALIHQIPFAGDILHPFIGYPVHWGLPPGAPRSRDVKVVSFDGTQIYVHFMPASGLAQGERAPTVLNAPGLGVPGATNLDGTFLDPVLADALGVLSPGLLRRAGYNVVSWDPRGEWNSGGTLELNAAEFEGRDMAAIISWIATQPEVQLDAPGDPRLGMVGVSYGGGIQLVTAANDTRVDAIVPSIAYHRLDTALYKSEAFKSSWATTLTAVITLLSGRANPRILPATVYGDLTGDISRSDLDLFISRNPDVSKITVPTLLIQGTVDTLFSLAEADATARILLANDVPTKVIWFCGGHGLCANNLFDLSDGVLIEQQTLAWLDRYVKGDPNAVTGPQFEWVDQRGQWFSAEKYPVTPGTQMVATSDCESALPLIPFLGGSGFPFVPYAIGAVNAVNLKVPAATATTYLVGAPKLTLTYSGTGSAEHVYAQLVDDTTGLVLGSIVTPVPVTLDGVAHEITIDLEPVSHTLRSGESVTLQIVSSAGLYETIIPTLGNLSVTSIRLSLPTADPAQVTPFTVTGA